MINPVGSNLNILDHGIGSSQQTQKEKGPSFANLLKEKMASVNQLQLDADQITKDFALGKVDSIHQVTIATEKAQLALSLTLAIQNKVIDAYKEIMRMQF